MSSLAEWLQGNPPSEDRISGLPDDVICHILSFLPTTISVQTSTLAKRWRLLWAHVTSLHFDGDYHYTGNSFNNLVNTVMSRHEVQTIKTFRLFYDDDYPEFEFQKWVATAVARNVCNLEVRHNFMSPRLPQCLFTCKTLVDLSLTNCREIIMSDTPVYLPALKKLYLRYIQSEHDEYLSHLLSGCPVLEELIIQRDNSLNVLISSPTLTRLELKSFPEDFDIVEKLSRVKINTPALRYLRFHDSISESFSTGPLTCLTEADVGFTGLFEMDEEFNEAQMYEKERIIVYSRSVFEFVGKLCNVKRLKLSIDEMVVYDSTFFDLSIKFCNLTELELACDWCLIPSFLENADNLQVLRIRLVNGDHTYWMEPDQVPTSLLSHLRIVTVFEFWCSDDELELIRYLLKNAEVLKWMEINSIHGLDVNIRFEALKTVAKFERGSDACALEFH